MMGATKSDTTQLSPVRVGQSSRELLLNLKLTDSSDPNAVDKSESPLAKYILQDEKKLFTVVVNLNFRS